MTAELVKAEENLHAAEAARDSAWLTWLIDSGVLSTVEWKLARTASAILFNLTACSAPVWPEPVATILRGRNVFSYIAVHLPTPLDRGGWRDWGQLSAGRVEFTFSTADAASAFVRLNRLRFKTAVDDDVAQIMAAAGPEAIIPLSRAPEILARAMDRGAS